MRLLSLKFHGLGRETHEKYRFFNSGHGARRMRGRRYKGGCLCRAANRMNAWQAAAMQRLAAAVV